ncbi:MAG: class I SAM-dependent methyltransferase [Bacteroidota bacterium]
MSLKKQFGNIDIYLFDQLLKGRIMPGMDVLDAGCGTGRNLHYLLKEGFTVYGVDADEQPLRYTEQFARRLRPNLPADSFQVCDLAELPFEPAQFDVVICSAVLHFSRDVAHFHSMVDEMWRVLKPGGMYFARLASTIGVAHLVMPKEGGWYHLPDGSDRFLVDEAILLTKTEALGGTLLDPIKTTNVQNLRAMTTWVVRKG